MKLLIMFVVGLMCNVATAAHVPENKWVFEVVETIDGPTKRAFFIKGDHILKIEREFGDSHTLYMSVIFVNDDIKLSGYSTNQYVMLKVGRGGAKQTFKLPYVGDTDTDKTCQLISPKYSNTGYYGSTTHCTQLPGGFTIELNRPSVAWNNSGFADIFRDVMRADVIFVQYVNLEGRLIDAVFPMVGFAPVIKQVMHESAAEQRYTKRSAACYDKVFTGKGETTTEGYKQRWKLFYECRDE